MNGDTLLRSFSYLDDDLVERSETPRAARPWRPWAAAACLTLLLAAGLMLPRLLRPAAAPDPTPGPVPAPAPDPGQTWIDRPGGPTPPTPPEPADPYSYRHFFSWWERTALSADAAPARQYLKLAAERLTAEEYAAVLPERLFDWMRPEDTAVAEYLGDGTLDAVTLRVGSMEHDGEITVTLMPEDGARARYLDAYRAALDVHESEQIETGDRVTAWVIRANGWADLCAVFARDGVRWQFTTSLPEAELGRDRFCDVGDLVYCFAASATPDLSRFRMHETHTFAELTPAEARADPDFGAYFPREAPRGFTADTILRSGDTLTGNWSNGAYGYLTWRISRSWDASRVVSAAEREKYDLSLYPIPWAESVPRELREAVNDPVFRAEELTEALVAARTVQMSEAGEPSAPYVSGFTVLYGDVAVRVGGKGVDPAWLYAQLAALR